MENQFIDLRSNRNPKSRIKILRGHFATSNAHINRYIDMSTVKVRHNNARETAKTLVEMINSKMSVNTIVCLEDTQVIGAFMAQELAESHQFGLSRGNNISVVSPEIHVSGQILFRDNTKRMVEDQQVLILTASMNSGKSVKQAMESVAYYGGAVCGICSIFSTINKINGIEVAHIFSATDLPHYRSYPANDCPMCQEGRPLDAIVNSFGYSKLR